MSQPAPSTRAAVPDEGRRGSSEADLSRPFLLGAVVVVAAAALAGVLAVGTGVSSGQADDVRRVLGTTTALSGFAVFALCRATWRQIGDRAGLWAGAAALLVGVAAAARPELAGALLGDHSPGAHALGAVSTAAMAVAPVLLGAGLVPGLGRFRISAAGLVAGALAAVGLLSLVLAAADSVARSLTVAQLTSGEGAPRAMGGVLVAAAWLALAIGYTVRGLRRRWLHTWVGPMLFALTLSGLGAGAAGGDNGWAVGAAVLEAVGMVWAVVGCHLELTRAYEDQTLQLFDSTLEAETAEVRERVQAANLRARRHDLINAITAIDGAAVILEREFERLSDGDRQMLAGVFGSGAARLLRLINQEGAGESHVSLAAAAADVAKDPAWAEEVELDVTPDLVAAGSAGETAEALRQLVDYAYRRAPGSPMTLRGERDGEWVVLRVEDRGPTMPRQLRRTVTEPESRWAPGREEAIGLRVAARLMRGQGGDLWVEARPGGGSSFGICLPAASGNNGDAGADD